MCKMLFLITRGRNYQSENNSTKQEELDLLVSLKKKKGYTQIQADKCIKTLFQTLK